MSKEKQIEEMADVYDAARLKARETLGSMNEGEAMWYSKAFYNAGYRKQSEWISVEERLPDTTEKILVYCSNGEILPAKYIRVQGLEFWFEETYSCHNITHWMPLPEPPKMKGGEE